MSEPIAAFPNTANWYHNASFLLPLAATIAVAAFGGVRHSTETLGFAGFLAIVTFGMTPVVLAGWRHTATAVVLTRSGVVSLHNGQVLKALNWEAVRRVSGRETLGNVRWEIAAEGGETLLLDGELEDLPRLVQLARQLSGVPNEPEG
jgi:hypothetical protein